VGPLRRNAGDPGHATETRVGPANAGQPRDLGFETAGAAICCEKVEVPIVPYPVGRRPGSHQEDDRKAEEEFIRTASDIGFFARPERKPTLLYNGYGISVAYMYEGLEEVHGDRLFR